MIDIPRGTYIGERIGDPPAKEAEHYPLPGLWRLDQSSGPRAGLRARRPVATSGTRPAAVTAMALKMRATGLSSPVDEHLTDFTVITGELVIGRIYEFRGSPPDLRWFWSLALNGPMKRSDRVASLDEAKDQ
jgi:hypothetical protein